MFNYSRDSCFYSLWWEHWQNPYKEHYKSTLGKTCSIDSTQILAVLFFNFLGIASFVDVLPPPLSVSDICYITVQNTPESGGVLFLGISKYLCQNPCKRLSAHSIVKCLSGAYLISRMEPISMRSYNIFLIWTVLRNVTLKRNSSRYKIIAMKK